MRKEQFDTWFRGFRLGEVTREEIVFIVPSGFVRDWLNRYYLDTINQAVRDTVEELGREQPAALPKLAQAWKVILCLDHTSPPCSESAVTAAAQSSSDREKGQAEDHSHFGTLHRIPTTAGGVARPVETLATSPITAATPLNKDYTFEHFVVGPSNQLSHAAALAVGQNPGRAYNPLFIHGNVGLGKTHLLQSICHAVRRRTQLSSVVYLSCEDFTNRFILAIQSGRLNDFRDYYRSTDVLVIDDVQFLAGKDKTQEEFFHTFNALYNGQKQIVISSDRPPVEIPTVEERLVSRFKWGLVTDIEQPTFETRLAIVKRKARMRSIDLPEGVAHFIAERITTNIREVEGAVIKVIGVAAITDRSISLDLAEEALQGISSRRSNQISIPDVISLIASEFSISARDLTGKSRTQAVSLPRQIGMFLARDHTDHSLEEVGRYFGNRDHTTVLYAVTKIKKRAESDRMFKELLAKLSSRLQSGSFQRMRSD